ncbi:hypothetical protein [Natrinema altunense]|uniref:Uncharacterized protein n=1 Tax=Natrinema altunense (strain JCM 12890 / CGMCC 1.3731 / AJ2) TaxID=1227494 RepID=L9ZR93_NATA2|nr:hypothetical protein [Natrinema altunense]ELY89005.1 hypothetical protein C485_05486 [Natrinema altunense JCM 12890]
MDRRTLLVAGGTSLTTLASGCLSDSSTPDRSADEPDNGTEKSRSPSPDAGISVTDIVVRKAVTYESMMGSGGVHAEDGTQYIVASVQADEDLRASDFTFETAAESWTPGLPDSRGGTNFAVAGHGGRPVGRHSGGEESYLAFAVPSPLSASNPRIRYADADTTWPLTAAGRERLAAPAPSFELLSLTVPDTVSRGEPLPVSLTVTNTSETDGRFLAALYWPTERIADDDESHILEREVSAGDDATFSLELDTEYTTETPDSVTLSLRGYLTADREVTVRERSARD